jgi:hypothetical protein
MDIPSPIDSAPCDREETMKRRGFITLTSVLIQLLAITAARAAGLFQPGLVGTYSSGFDATGYQAPGTNTDVDVGGVFTLTIDGKGNIAQSNATLSVDDGGQGPAVCNYASGAGQVTTLPYTGTLGSASFNYQADQGNSSLCPPSDASLTFGYGPNGLACTYTSSSGFIGHGICELAATPSAGSFDCSYTAKGDKGTGSGLGSVVFSPHLNQKPTTLNLR